MLARMAGTKSMDMRSKCWPSGEGRTAPVHGDQHPCGAGTRAGKGKGSTRLGTGVPRGALLELRPGGVGQTQEEKECSRVGAASPRPGAEISPPSSRFRELSETQPRWRCHPFQKPSRTHGWRPSPTLTPSPAFHAYSALTAGKTSSLSLPPS